MLPKSTSLLEKAAAQSIVRSLYIHTPALTAGANNSLSQNFISEQSMAEARLSSLLGVLRFWWRSTIGQTYKSDERRRREIAIFGGPAAEDSARTRNGDRSGSGGTGCFTADLLASSNSVAFRDTPVTKDGTLLQLLGNGVSSNRDAAMPTGEYGVLSLHFHPRKDPTYRAEVLNSLEAMCAFGGIGLLGRRGLGSISAYPPGSRNLKDAVSDNNTLVTNLSRREASSTSTQFRLVSWPVDKPDSMDALAEFAAHLKTLRLKADFEGNLERLSDVLSSQASWRRADKGGNRRPSPVAIKVLSCVYEGRAVQLITALLLPSAFMSESIDKAPTTLSARLNLVFDSLEKVTAEASIKFPGAFA